MEMITASDSFSTIDLGRYYAILPTDGLVHSQYEANGVLFKAVDLGFAYNSGSNPDFLTVEQLRDLIRKYVDKSFNPV